MGITNRLVIFLLSVFFVIALPMYGQETKREEALIEVIANLQKQYNVQFNYAEDAISNVFVKPPSEDYTLSETLNYLELQTSFLFTLVDSNFVLLRQKDDIIVCGYIKGQDNLEPLFSATIQGLKDATVSNEEGFFQLKVSNESELITIRYLGYKEIKRSYKHFLKDGCGSIYMRPNEQVLPTVLISNYITTGINKINNGSYQIDFNRFDILPGLIDNDVLQSVQAFPGIHSINETVSNINIRGGTHDQNLILWDDIKMYQSGHFFGLISMFNPQITRSVSLLKNGSEVSYTDGVSGTINMETDKNVNVEFKGNIGVNLTDANAFVDTPIGTKSSIQIGGRKSISEFLNTPTYDNYFERISQDTEVDVNETNITNSDKVFDFYDVSLRWIYKVTDRDEVRLNFITVSNELAFNETGTINNNISSRESNLSQNSIAGALNYNRIWNDRLQTTFTAYETDYKLKAVNVNVLDAQRFLQENVVSETSLKLKGTYILSDRLSLLGGYHFVETEVTNLDDVDTPIFRLLVSEVVRTHGVFSQLFYRSSNQNTHLNAGLRFNYIDKFDKQILEPRLSLSQRFLDFFTIEILGELKHQNTSQVINFQSDFLGIEKRRWQLSNDADVPVITSRQLSVGVNYSQNGWLTNIEGYYKNVEGITSQSQGFQNQYEFDRSTGSYEVTGFDVLVRKNMDFLNAWLSYSYMNNLYTFEEYEEYSFPSNYDITHVLSLGATYSHKNLKVSAGMNWRTGKPTTEPIEDNEIVDGAINYGETNGARLEDYMRIDVSALYDFKLGSGVKARAGISIWNILDKDNEINNFYRINEESINETVQRSLGLTPNAVLRVSF